MAVLLLRLNAPLQSWGCESRFDTRDTGREPTKSGVIGMIAAALGIPRESGEEALERLNKLRFGVRIEREGRLLKDYHTAKSSKSAYVTNRYYLADAVFLVGLESDDTELLSSIQTALHSPVYPLFLGRRSCPPTLPIDLGIEQGGLLEILQSTPRIVNASSEEVVRIVYDTDEGGKVVQDKPLSYSQIHRRYGFRKVCESEAYIGGHDPMKGL